MQRTAAPPPAAGLPQRIFVIAHAPLAHALRQAVLHVFPDSAEAVVALDVQPQVPPEESLATARVMLEQLRHRAGSSHGAAGTAAGAGVLLLTDLFGATPCNVAQQLADGAATRLVCGVNLPMLLRTVTYRHEPLDALVSRAVAGGMQGVMQVATAAPQNQARRSHDPSDHDHQQ